MLRHGDIWTAIDRLAEAHNLSASGLARRAGLDPTTFNKSKRFSATRPRWPSTESLSKILEVTGTSLAEFVFYLEPPNGPGWRLPVIPWTAAGEAGRFDETGKPAGDQWSERRFANVADGTAFGVEIGTDEMWPIYSRGASARCAPAMDTWASPASGCILAWGTADVSSDLSSAGRTAGGKPSPASYPINVTE